MAILDTIKKGFLRITEDGTNYITLKPKTDASLVSMNDGTLVENRITSLSNDKINKTNIANNLTTTSTDYVLDARQGKELKDLVDEQNRNMEIKQTSLTSANAAYFGGDCFAFSLPGGAYLIKARIVLTGAIISGHNADVFKGFPWKWKYTTGIPGATLNNGSSIVMQGAQGESSLKLGAGHGALPVGTTIDLIAVLPPQFIIFT